MTALGQRSVRHQPAVFLDRDGTLNRDNGYTYRIEDLILLDHVVEGLQLLTSLGFRLVVTTNQAGIGRGYFTEHQMHLFHRAMSQNLASAGIRIDDYYWCPFHPTAGVGSYRADSPMRKPNPGMILQAAADLCLDLSGSFAIGDKYSDVQAGKAAGCRAILVRSVETSMQDGSPAATPDFEATNLLEAARWIQQQTRQPIASS